MGPTGHLVTIKRSGVDGPHFPLSLSTCLFGRSTECDIRIQLPIVSKQHCKIEIKEQKAILFNFSSTYPTQLNGSAIDGPVQLKHGDVITIIDRSFRYEDESHQNGSKSTEFPGQRHEQASPRRVSTSGFYSDPDGKVQDPKACSKLSEESVPGGPLGYVWAVRAAPTVSHASEEPVARETPDVHLSHLPGDDGREAAGPAAGDAKDVSSVPALSGNGQLPSFPSIQCLENSEENESPFRELYESMKEKLDRRSEKENVLRSRRKSRSRSHSVAENESAGGSQGETPRLASPKSRRTSGRGTQSKADPASGAQPSGQTEEKGTHAGPVQTPKVTVSPSVPRKEATETGTPGLCSHQRFTPKRRSGGRRVIHGDEPVNLDESGESSRVDNGTLLPRKSLTRNQTPTKLENAENVGNTPGKVLSKKRRRSSSAPANGDVLTETETQKQTALAPLLIQVERKMPDGALGTSEPLGAPGGQRCPGSPGLRSVDVSNFGDSTNMIEGMPLKRRRVSFGGHLRPELFDENLPPNTPLKRGETPMKRRSLVTHTATTALKKIIKEQSQPSGNEDSSSETHLGVTAQNVFRSSPARNPVRTPAANDKRRRSSEPSSASSGGASPQQTETPKRGGRRSSSGPSRRTSVDRSQQEILQLIHSKRRSGASEANLIVAKSWADVVKLSAKQTQTKVIKHGPRRQLNKRQRRINTPKKPTSSVHNQFSTGHANSPCTIVVGKAHIEKVNVPARPYRMLNNFVFNRKIDFNEDLSGLTEMFKTPAKEKPQVRSLCPTTFSNSEDLHRVPKPEEKPLLCTPENYGDNVFPSTQNVQEQMSNKRSASPALRQHCFAVNENMKTLLSEAEPPKEDSSTNKSRRSMELRNTQVPGAECENEDEGANAAENILGRCLRKTREEKLEEEMKESERTFETCEKNIESKENSEKMIAVKRSRRSSEMKYAQKADLSTPKKLQEIEPKQELVDSHSLGIPGRTKEPVDVENRTAVMNCKSPEPDSVSTPVKMNVRIKLPSQKVNVGQLSALGRSSQTPGETTHSHREQVGDDKIIELFKETPEQKLDPTENVTGSRRRSRTPKKKVQPLEDLAGFRELFQTPNRSVEPVVDDKTTKIPHKSPKPEPVIMSGDDKDIRALKETPEQKLDHIENVTGRRRRSRTPQRKVQPLEDLAGFKELFQTPTYSVEPVVDDKTTKIPHKSPKPEPMSTPGDDKDIREFNETPKQTLDSAENVTGSRKRTRTPKRKVQPLEDMDGFKELFQTPKRTVEPVTDDRTTKIAHKSPKPEPVTTPGDDKDIRALKETPKQKLDHIENVTGRRRRSRTPKRKVQPLEDMVGVKELFQTPKCTVEPVTDDRTTKIPHKSPKPELVSMPGDDKDIREFNETPEQKLDSAENVTGNRKRPRTPKRKVQPLEDMAGFKEPFQTPNQSMEPEVDDKTKLFCQSTHPEPVVISTSMPRQLRTPPQKVSGEEDVSALRKSTRTPGGTMGSPRDPVGDGKIIKFFKETPEQKLDSAENVTGSRKKPRTPKKKVEPLEDLAGFKELFQTPKRTVEPVVDDKTTKIPHKSPKPEPVSMPGDDKDIREFNETSEQKLDSAANVTGSRKTPRTPKRKVQPLEDMDGFKELFQTPKHTVEPVTDEKNKIPCKSPQAETVMPIGRKSCLKAPPAKADIEVEPLSLRKPTRTSRKTTRSQREPEGDEKDVTVFKESAVQKPDPANNVTRSKRKPRTPEEKAQPLEDLARLEEPFPTSDHTDEPVTVVKTTRMRCQSSQPGPGILPTSKKRRLKAAPGKADGEEEPLSLRKPTRASRKTTRSHREPDNDGKDVTVFKESAVQKLDPANNVTRSKRKPRTPEENTQTLEDLAGLKEPFQTPNHTVEPVTDDKTKIPCKSPQAEAVMPTGRKSCLKAPPAKADIEVEPLSLRKPTRTSRKTTRSQREPEGDEKDVTVLKESAVQKPDPANNVTRSKRKPRTPEEKAQPLEDLARLEEPFQTSDHTDEPVTVVKTTRMHCQSSQPGPGILPASKKRRLKAAPGKADGEEEPTALRKPTRTGRSTRAHRESVDGHQDVIVCEGPAKPKRGLAENATGSKRLLRTRKEKAPPLEVPAGCPELLQTADPDKEHGNDAENVKRTPTQTPDRRELVKTSRRVLRAPRVKPMDDLAGSRDPVKSRSESSVSQSPKRKRGKEGTVTGRETLGSTTCPQDTAPEMPLQKRQRTAPSERCEPPAPLVTKKTRQRLLAGRTEPVEELPNSMRTKTQEQKEAVASPAKGISLRSRPPKKTSGSEQRRPEFLESAEKTNVKRNGKKAPNTSQKVTLQHLEDGAKNSTSGGQVRERRMCLRSRRQSMKHLSDVTEEKAWEKSVETHVMKKTQEKKEGSKRSGSVGLRPKKTTVCPPGDPLEKESKQRVTRSVKRSTENIKKEDDNGCIKKLRTRRHRGSEDI